MFNFQWIFKAVLPVKLLFRLNILVSCCDKVQSQTIY